MERSCCRKREAAAERMGGIKDTHGARAPRNPRIIRNSRVGGTVAM